MLKKRIISLILVILISVGLTNTSANASENDDNDDFQVDAVNYMYIIQINTACRLTSGKIKFTADILCDSSLTSSCTATAYLQRRYIGTYTWQTVDSKSVTDPYHAIASKEYTCVAGYEYRCKGEYAAYGIGNSTPETTTGYSKTITVAPSNP